MLEIPTLRTLQLQAEQDTETEINGSLGSRIRSALALALAGIGYALFKTLQYLSRQQFLDQADDTFALLWASIYGITANPATQAAGETQATGAEFSTFAGGEVLTRGDGAQFIVDGPQGPINASGTILIDVIALEGGTSGNTVLGEGLTFTSPPAGVDAATVVAGTGITDGFDAEDAESVRARTLALIRAARRGGSEPDYEIWATSVPGVSQAFARGSAFGIGTVLVIIAQEWDPAQGLSGTNTPVPTPALIAAVEAKFEIEKPGGLHGVFVQGPVLQELDPYIVLTPDTPDIRDSVTRSLALALARVEPGGVARYDDLVISIDRAAGEEHHRLFVQEDGVPLSFGPYDTLVGELSLLVPGTLTWTEPP